MNFSDLERVAVYATSSGIGALVLSEDPIPGGYFPFPASKDGVEVPYVAINKCANEVEVGRGVYTHATRTLSRSLIERSSNEDERVNFSQPPLVFSSVTAYWLNLFQTGSGGVDSVTYTLNGASADANGNFTLTLSDIGGVEAEHAHAITEVDGLQEALAAKSEADHTHDYVTTVSVDGVALSSSLLIETQGQLLSSTVGQVVTLTAELPAHSMAAEVEDASTDAALQVFTGTQAQWDAFVPTSGKRYLVFIHE